MVLLKARWTLLFLMMSPGLSFRVHVSRRSVIFIIRTSEWSTKRIWPMSCFTARWCYAVRKHKLRLLNIASIVSDGIHSVEGGAKRATKQDIAIRISHVIYVFRSKLFVTVCYPSDLLYRVCSKSFSYFIYYLFIRCIFVHPNWVPNSLDIYQFMDNVNG